MEGKRTVENLAQNSSDFRWLLIVTTLILVIFLGTFLIYRLRRKKVLQDMSNDYELLED
jgi:hypothetical protein